VIRAFLAPLLAAAALTVLPTVALAQDAGGGQYTDPLAGGGTSGSHSTNNSSGNSGGNSSGSSSGSSSSASTSSTATAQAGTSTGNGATTASASSSGLPRTGFPVGFLAFAGGILVSFGLGLRRVVHGHRA